MKKLLIAALVLIGLSSCGKTEEKTTPTPTTKSYVKYKFNGTLVTHDLTTTESFISNTGLNVIATAGNGGVAFEAIIPTTTGTYDITASASLKGHFLFIRPTPAGYMLAIERASPGSSGTFTITKVKSIDGVKFAANGTFSGTAVDDAGVTATITEGEFFDVRTN